MTGFRLKVESLCPTLKVQRFETEWIWVGLGDPPSPGRFWGWFRRLLIRRRRLWMWWEAFRLICRRPPNWRMKNIRDYLEEAKATPYTSFDDIPPDHYGRWAKIALKEFRSALREDNDA